MKKNKGRKLLNHKLFTKCFTREQKKKIFFAFFIFLVLTTQYNRQMYDSMRGGGEDEKNVCENNPTIYIYLQLIPLTLALCFPSHDSCNAFCVVDINKVF